MRVLKLITRFKHLVISNALVFQPFRKTLCEWHHQSCWYVISNILCKKTRCYPQQRLGNNASKENLRARIFPILGEVSWCFEIFAVTTSELQGVTATCFTNVVRKLNFPKPFQNLKQNLPNWRDTAQNIFHNPFQYWSTATATGSPREPSRHPIPLSATRSFSIRSGTLPGFSREPTWNLLGTLPRTFPNPVAELCPRTSLHPWNPAQNLLRNLPGILFRNLPGTLPEHCAGTCPEPSRNPWFGSRPGTAPEPILAKTP